MRKTKELVDLEGNLVFAGTIYESFEALEEVMGKLKLERPLFLIYLAKKEFAEAVFKVSEEDTTHEYLKSKPTPYVEIFNPHYQSPQ